MNKKYTPEEIWKPIPGFPNYVISNEGRIYSTRMKQLRRFYTGNRGYVIVQLSKNHTVYARNVHRLMAEVFINNPDKKPMVNHIDGDKTNFKLRNLEWVTSGENIKHDYENGRREANREHIKSLGAKKYKPVRQYTKNWQLIKEYPSIKEAVKITGCSYESISNTLRGRYKSGGGYIWEYTYPKFDNKVIYRPICCILGCKRISGHLTTGTCSMHYQRMARLYRKKLISDVRDALFVFLPVK